LNVGRRGREGILDLSRGGYVDASLVCAVHITNTSPNPWASLLVLGVLEYGRAVIVLHVGLLTACYPVRFVEIEDGQPQSLLETMIVKILSLGARQT